MIRTVVSTLIAIGFASGITAAKAAGHIEQGRQLVHTKCKICHSIVNGEDVILKGNTVGPNLFGIIGQQAGIVDGYDYSDTTVEAGEAGLVWSEQNLIDYLPDTKAFMVEYLGDDSARSRMSYRVRDADERAAIAAYLATYSE